MRGLAILLALLFPPTPIAEQTPASAEQECAGLPGFVRIPAGVFAMGSPASEPGRDGGERDHRVFISRPFWLSRGGVTQDEWFGLMGTTPSTFSGCGACPVEQVSWYDATSYADALSAAQGLTQCYTSGADPVTDCDGWRLPTESEHEYAMRAGRTGTCGISPEASCAYTVANDAAFWHCGNAACSVDATWSASAGGQCPAHASCVAAAPILTCNQTQPNCSKPANAWGVCDWAGNLFDWNHDDAGCTATNTVDPEGRTTMFGSACSGPATSARKKGGSIKETAGAFGRPAARSASPKADTEWNVGLRVARTIDPTSKPALVSAIAAKELGATQTWDFAWRGSGCPAAGSSFVSTEGGFSTPYVSGTWSCDQSTTSLTPTSLDGEFGAAIDNSGVGCWSDVTNPPEWTIAAGSDIHIRAIVRADRPPSGVQYLFRLRGGATEEIVLELQADGDTRWSRRTSGSATPGANTTHILTGAIPSGAAQWMVIDAYSGGAYGHMITSVTTDAGTVWGGTSGAAAFGSHEGGSLGLFGAQGSCTSVFDGSILFLGVAIDSPWTSDRNGPWQTPVSTQWANRKAYEAMCGSPPCT